MGQIFLAENESHIYPNMCSKFGCGPTVVSKKGGDRQTDKRTRQLYILEEGDVNKYVGITILYGQTFVYQILSSTGNI